MKEFPNPFHLMPLQIKEPPNVAGEYAHAWMFDLDNLRRKRPSPKPDAQLDIWLIYAPGANIAWHSYMLSLTHLRPIPGYATKFYLKDATHELTLWAVNPEKTKLVTLDEFRYDCLLSPVNFAAQFIAESDQRAQAQVHACVMDMAAGTLSPDTDYTQLWIARFNDAMFHQGKAERAGETVMYQYRGDGTKRKIVIDPKQPGDLPYGPR